MVENSNVDISKKLIGQLFGRIEKSPKIQEYETTDIKKISKIIGEYKDNINIVEIDFIVRSSLSGNRNLLSCIDNKLKFHTDNIYNKKSISCLEYKKNKKKIDQLLIEKDNILTDKKLNSYINETSYLIEEYKKNNCKEDNIQFYNCDKDFPDNTNDICDINNIIYNYLEITKKYFNIQVIKIITKDSNVCENCFQNIEISNSDNGITFCSNCYCERPILTKNLFYKDPDNECIISKQHIDGDNFYKAVLRYQGKQAPLPDKVYKDIECYLKSFCGKSLEDIKNSFCDSRGRKENTSREIISNALKTTGNEDYYGDINLICHIIWGWALPYLGDLEDIIMDDYEQTQKYYNLVKGDRKSGLNLEFRLFFHLKTRNFDCHASDFKLADTDNVIEYHIETFYKMARLAKLPIVPIHI